MYEKHDGLYPPPPRQYSSLTGSSRRNGRNLVLSLVLFLLCIMITVAEGQDSVNDPFSECRVISADAEDPLYGCQWHLKNTGQLGFSGKAVTAGEDINVEGVWNEDVYGSGINVAIVSDGIDLSHEDLSAKVRSGLNWSYFERNNSEENSSEKYNSERDDHSDGSSFTGTRAAGVIAATGYNGLGVRGTAPGASIYSYRLSGDLSEADAMVRNKEITAVSVNGRVSEDGAFFQEASSVWEEGLDTGIREGFYGKGVFYVWGAGDGHENNDQANFNEYSSYYGVTAVCSTDGFGKKSIFSEEGVNLWVCAPGSDIVTTDNNNDYVVTSGTVLSASQVGGVAALLREVNGNLSWRDIKLILAGSARQNDVSDMSWETGAVKYGSDVERYNYNPKYGFGVVDAEAAAELAGSWKGIGEMRTITASSDNELTIPDGEGEADGILTSTLVIPDVEEIFTEFVEVELVFSHDRLQDLDIKITSPSGTVSELVREFSGEEEDAEISYVRRTHRFGSAKHLGEDPSGEWTLDISDTASGDEADEENTFTLHSWSIKVYGNFYQGPGREITTKALNWGGQTVQDQVYRVGTQIAPLQLPEATGAEGITYSMTPDLPAGLEFNDTTRVISGTPTKSQSNERYQIVARDENGNVKGLAFHIRVRFRNSTIPSFSDTIPDQNYVTGREITPLVFPSATGGDGQLRYTFNGTLTNLPNGLRLTSDPFRIRGTPGSGSAGTSTWQYTATDSDGDTATLEFRIRIKAAADVPSFGGQMIDDKFYTAMVQISPFTLPLATQGTGITLRLTPNLPDGLNFNFVTQVISGTPTAAMPKTDYTWRATDRDGYTAELTFSITITALSFDGQVPSSPVLYLAERPVTPLTLPAATGGTAPYTYVLTPELPDGLDFNDTTRVISGTPTAATPVNTYTYTVTDADGTETEVTFDIAVAAHFSGVEIESRFYTVGTAVTETLPEAIGHNGTVTYSLTPAPPAELTFTPATRVISGTPTAIQKNARLYTYSAATGAGVPARTLVFHITVRDEPDTRPSFGGETVEDKEYIISGSPITPFVLPEATGGNGTVTYSLTPRLPDGLIFTPVDRETSGTLTAAMSETDYTWSATDEDNDRAGLTFSITVEEDSEPAFSVTTIEDQVYTGERIRLPVATGGNPPLRYSIDPRLPTGMRLNEDTGVISGTPASASPATSYTYTVTDRNGDMKGLTFRLSAEVSSTPGPTTGRPGTSGSDSGGGGGGCAVSDQSSTASDIPGVIACLILIPVSVVIKRKRRSQIKT